MAHGCKCQLGSWRFGSEDEDESESQSPASESPSPDSIPAEALRP